VQRGDAQQDGADEQRRVQRTIAVASLHDREGEHDIPDQRQGETRDK
jgi:hypothetical protein